MHIKKEKLQTFLFTVPKKKIKNFDKFWKFIDTYKTDIGFHIQNTKCKVIISHHGYINEEYEPDHYTIAAFCAEQSSFVEISITSYEDNDTHDFLHQKWFWLGAEDSSRILVQHWVKTVNFNIVITDNVNDKSTVKIINHVSGYKPNYENLFIPSYTGRSALGRIVYENGLCQCEIEKHCHRSSIRLIGKIQPTIHRKDICWRSEFNYLCDKWADESSSEESESDDEPIITEESKPSSSSSTTLQWRDVENCMYCGKQYQSE
jgi:hypothetical protein